MESDPFSLEGKVAIITGGSRGIGEEIAVAMAEAGAAVAPVARSEDALEETVERIEASGGTAHSRPLDVTDVTAVEAAFDEIEAELGDVEILVHNVGTNPFLATLGFGYGGMEQNNLRQPNRGFPLCTRVGPPG